MFTVCVYFIRQMAATSMTQEVGSLRSLARRRQGRF